MKSANKYIVNVLAVGFVTLTILSTLLFWARKVCYLTFYGDMVGKAGQLKIQPSGLVPDLDNDPNVDVQSCIETCIENDVVADSLGILQDSWALAHGKSGRFSISGKYSTIGENKARRGYHLILFDKDSGLFVYYDVFKKKRGWNKKATFYAGPKGISKTADKNLGRFSGPHKNLWSGYAGSFTFFDKSLSSFFQIKFYEGTVVKSPQLPEDYTPVQMGGFDGFDKNGGSLRLLAWSPPLRKATAQDKIDKKTDYISAVEEGTGVYSKQYSLVLDKSGKIRKLNNKTLELGGAIAYLPRAPLFDREDCVRPKELFAYKVLPFTAEGRYSGTIVGSISREAMGIRVVVFDENGQLVENEGVSITNSIDTPGGPLLVVVEYVLENLQPAFSGMLSYFTAWSFEATAGHRGLFILPNSLVAIFNREAKGIVGPLFGAMIIISPSIVLGVLLGFAVYKDATVTGFSKRAKRCWLLGTILFGLSAYITYRLTRPKETLVTCQNCGKLRRPDMARCHRCGSKWVVPELTPPTWRVIDTPHKEVIS